MALSPEFSSRQDEDEFYMQLALSYAGRARDEGEVPVGAVIVWDREVIGAAQNQRVCLQDPTAHAEVLAITQASEAVGSWRLEKCTLYVTLEPCAMCAGAIILARIPRVVWGADDPKAGACGSVLDVLGCARLNHNPEVKSGVLAEPCSEILKTFFREKRARKECEEAGIEYVPEAHPPVARRIIRFGD